MWWGGRLMDVAAGWRLLEEPAPRSGGWAPFGDFDTALMSPLGDLTALVDSDGTKALLLEPGGRVVRELNRSWYCADAYRYPLAMFTLPDGQTAVVHCPEHYNQLEIEVARTGQRLTAVEGREPADVFHSRLQISPGANRLLSAGWLWHPIGTAVIYDLDDAFRDPKTMDPLWLTTAGDFADALDAEVAGACWVSPDDVVVATSAEGLNNDVGLGELKMGRWSGLEQRFVWRRPIDADLGDLLSFHGDVLAVNGHPRLFSASTGELMEEWPEVTIAPTQGSMLLQGNVHSGSAVVAIDPDERRFAVRQEHVVFVVTPKSAQT